MNKIITLDKKYSTTRLLTKEKPVIENKPEDKVQTALFLPESEVRKGEGGLRRKGYFKHSYEKKGDKWYIKGTNKTIEEIDEYVNQPKDASTTPQQSKHHQQSLLPLISIITVVYNGEKYLEETIRSVVNQSYPNVEYIIIDGGSSDGTLDIIKRYDNCIDYWVSERDDGVSSAFNKGLKAVTGDIIGIINSDDKYCRDIFISIVEKFVKKQIDYLYGNMILQDRTGKKIKIVKSSLKNNFPYGGMPFGHPTLFVKKNVFNKVGFFNVKYKVAMDFELFVRIYDNNFKGLYLDKEIAVYSRGGVSDRNFLTGHREVLKATLMRKESSSIVALLYYMYGIFKTILRKILKL